MQNKFKNICKVYLCVSYLSNRKTLKTMETLKTLKTLKTMETFGDELNLEFEISYGVNFLHSVGILCEAKYLREFYADYPELPRTYLVWESANHRALVWDNCIEFYGSVFYEDRLGWNREHTVKLKTLDRQQLNNIYACWAWTSHKNNPMKASKIAVSVETSGLDEEREVLENRISGGVYILRNKFGICATADDIRPYYTDCEAIPDGGTILQDDEVKLYVSSGELVEEKTALNPVPETVGNCANSPRVVILGGAVQRRTMPLSQFTPEHMAGLFALWAWNQHLESNGN